MNFFIPFVPTRPADPNLSQLREFMDIEKTVNAPDEIKWILGEAGTVREPVLPLPIRH